MATERAVAAVPKRPGWMHNFAHPRGLVGTAVGWLMARKNRGINELAVAALDPAPDASLLEIGFGPGVAIELLAAVAPHASIHGIDISAAMVRQASRRNRRRVSAGAVRLRQGAAEALPYPEDSFDGVLATNSYHLWPDQPAALAEILRVLRPGGRLVLGLRTAPAQPGKYVAPGFSAQELRTVCEQLEAAGFTRIERGSGVADGREVVLLSART